MLFLLLFDGFGDQVVAVDLAYGAALLTFVHHGVAVVFSLQSRLSWFPIRR